MQKKAVLMQISKYLYRLKEDHQLVNVELKKFMFSSSEPALDDDGG
jgi:hypothetical protein